MQLQRHQLKRDRKEPGCASNSKTVRDFSSSTVAA
eukprot:CAMPEP_0171925896 /NCGR_PEP_ID=MMETSP0993-20121228/24459_1 /TAXON_ID=483369 /ORGANISM="non described non described, Strain CCMP2098" /LENGTH=34 /DNA_ID= /DNA_START= /DNA_END= /DNA_ORIENTATION=